MKKILLTLLSFGFFLFVSATNTPKVGDALMIKSSSSQGYNYIKFPQPNILIKRGVVTGYKSVINTTVIIDKVETKENGATTVILKKKDGSKFFGFVDKVKANYAKAIEAGELVVIN